MHLNWFDIVLVIIVCLSALLGLWRGLLKEVISLLSWLTAFFVSILFTKPVSIYLGQYIQSETVSLILSFVTLFVIVLIIGFLVNFIVGRLVDKSNASFINHLFGGLFGVGRGILILLFIVFLITSTKFQESKWFQNSKLSYAFQDVSVWIQERIVPSVKKTVKKRLKAPL